MALTTDRLLAEVESFSGFGTPTVRWEYEGIPYFVGQFWTARQRQSHSIHEVSYRACFKAQLPEFFILRLTDPGEMVYDPFAGRGTTPVQAALMGRIPAGNDINPLSYMLSVPRLNTPDIAAVIKRLHEIFQFSSTPQTDFENDLRVFYHWSTLHMLLTLKKYLCDKSFLDPVDQWIRMVALNRLTGHSSGYFSVYTLPPNQAASLEAQKKINAAGGRYPEARDVPALILKKSKNLLKDGPVQSSGLIWSSTSAWNTPGIDDASVSLVVTSPPFLDVVDYNKDNWLRNWFADVQWDASKLSQIKKPADWQAMVRNTLTELARVVKPGGHVAFEVGEVRGGTVLLEQLVWAAAEGLPFDRIGVIVNGGDFTKTAKIWKVDNNSKGTNTNRIVLLERR